MDCVTRLGATPSLKPGFYLSTYYIRGFWNPLYHRMWLAVDTDDCTPMPRRQEQRSAREISKDSRRFLFLLATSSIIMQSVAASLFLLAILLDDALSFLLPLVLPFS
jgi:hypothetical protein